MIPIGLPSIEFVLIRLAFILVALLWLGWTVRLCLSAKARQGLTAAWAIAYVLLTGVSFYTLWTIYDVQRQFSAYKAEHQANFRPTLSEGLTVGTIAMPTGTALELTVPNQLSSFHVARFPDPLNIGGVETLLAERYVSIQTGDDYQTIGYAPENIRLSGRGESSQQGWICDATRPITFSTHRDGSLDAFESCTLAAGNDVHDSALPPGAEIVATTGTVYSNGHVDPDRWLIHLPEHGEFRIGDSVQQGGALLLDAKRKLFRQVPR